MDKVSLVIPVFNASKTIQRCLDSIVSQSYHNLEIICVDDGSIDDSLLICQRFATTDDRVVVIHQENAGVSSARNHGIKAVTGDYIMFVDSDDWIEPITVETALQYVNNETDVVVFSFINEYGNKTTPCVLDKKNFCITDVLNQYVDSNEIILCTTCNKLYKTSLIKDNDITFPYGIKFGEDFIFNTKVYQFAHQIESTSDLLYHYDCTNENSAVKKLYKNYDEFINAMDDALMTLMNKLSVETKQAEKYRQNFIGMRWFYAVDICVHSNGCVKEKAYLLKKWFSKMPPQYLNEKTITEGKFGALINQVKMDSSNVRRLKKEIRKLLRQERIKAVVMHIKMKLFLLLKKKQ